MTRSTRRLFLRNATAAGAVATVGSFVVSSRALAQDTVLKVPPGPDASPVATDPAGSDAVIAALLEAVTTYYVFPSMAQKIVVEIRAIQDSGAYLAFTDPATLAHRLTDDLREIAGDKHLGVIYNPAGPPPPPTEAMLADMLDVERMRNFGIVAATRLPGNIGYLDVRGFSSSTEVEDALAPAMTFLGITSGLIIDVTQNGGGSPASVALLCSYLLGPEPVHLNSIQWRGEDRPEEFWTQPVLRGPRYVDKPVFILTSEATFSAGEEFAYNLQALKRATIVGEVTGGGANPARMFPLSDGFGATIPTGQAINPITGTNWEGTGVQPDLPVAGDETLVAAQIAALEVVIRDTDPTAMVGQMVITEVRQALTDLQS